LLVADSAPVAAEAVEKTAPTPVDGKSIVPESIQTIVDAVTSIWTAFLEHVPFLLTGLIVIIVTRLIARFFLNSTEKILKRFSLIESQKILITRFMSIVIWVFGIAIAFTVIFPDITVSKMLAGIGISSIAIGFAFKDIFENFLAGVLILWSFPFENGDFIECQGIVGCVENVTIRNTLVRVAGGELVVIPNATIFKNPVEVITDKKIRRATLTVGIAYSEDIASSKEIIAKAVAACTTIDKNIPVEVLANEFDDSSINFTIGWWTGSHPLDIRLSRHEVMIAVKSALDAANVEIPFPYRTLTFKEPLKADITQN
jgi:small-conductance mechanosensitive channel